MSPTNRSNRRRQPATATVIAALAMACFAAPARATLPCAAMPELQPTDVAQQVRDDAEEKTLQIRKMPNGQAKRHFVLVQRQEMREKFPTVDKPLLDSILMWTTCEAIAHDKGLVATQAFDEYSDTYRLLSEPIKAPAHHE